MKRQSMIGLSLLSALVIVAFVRCSSSDNLGAESGIPGETGHATGVIVDGNGDIITNGTIFIPADGALGMVADSSMLALENNDTTCVNPGEGVAKTKKSVVQSGCINDGTFDLACDGYGGRTGFIGAIVMDEGGNIMNADGQLMPLLCGFSETHSVPAVQSSATPTPTPTPTP